MHHLAFGFAHADGRQEVAHTPSTRRFMCASLLAPTGLSLIVFTENSISLMLPYARAHTYIHGPQSSVLWAWEVGSLRSDANPWVDFLRGICRLAMVFWGDVFQGSSKLSTFSFVWKISQSTVHNP